MHHGTCVTHVPWCMSGSLTCGDGEKIPNIPGACTPAILPIWQEAHSPPTPPKVHKVHVSQPLSSCWPVCNSMLYWNQIHRKSPAFTLPDQKWNDSITRYQVDNALLEELNWEISIAMIAMICRRRRLAWPLTTTSSLTNTRRYNFIWLLVNTAVQWFGSTGIQCLHNTVWPLSYFPVKYNCFAM